MLRGCLGGVGGYYGMSRVYFVSETAQVELKSGRGYAPAVRARGAAPRGEPGGEPLGQAEAGAGGEDGASRGLGGAEVALHGVVAQVEFETKI